MTFLSTPSARRATRFLACLVRGLQHFYPRPPRGGRRSPFLSASYSYSVFLSTPSARRATSRSVICALGDEFLSTPSARRATVCRMQSRSTPMCISIHALREEGDRRREGISYGSKRFLSTPSARRATRRAQRAGRPEDISIHALREEGDSCPSDKVDYALQFLSTPSARRATSR